MCPGHLYVICHKALVLLGDVMFVGSALGSGNYKFVFAW